MSIHPDLLAGSLDEVPPSQVLLPVTFLNAETSIFGGKDSQTTIILLSEFSSMCLNPDHSNGLEMPSETLHWFHFCRHFPPEFAVRGSNFYCPVPIPFCK